MKATSPIWVLQPGERLLIPGVTTRHSCKIAYIRKRTGRMFSVTGNWVLKTTEVHRVR